MRHFPYKIIRASDGDYMVAFNPGSRLDNSCIADGYEVRFCCYKTHADAKARVDEIAARGGFVAFDVGLLFAARQAQLMLLAIRDGTTPSSADLSNQAELLARSLPSETHRG